MNSASESVIKVLFRLLSLALPSVALLSSTEAQIVVTSTSTSNSGPGSLRQAVADAMSGETITFDGSLSGQTIPLTNGQILILNSVIIDAATLANGVTIDGQGRNRLFRCGSQTTNTFIRLTLTGGRTTGDGGAILNDSVLILNDCTLKGNTANEGGAIFDFGDLTLNRCTVFGNHARYGGGFENDGGTLTLNNSTVTGNLATNDGGGIVNFFTVTLNNSTVVSNTAFFGGGISNDDTLHLANSIVAGNTAGVSSSAQIGGPIDSSTGINLTSGNPMLAPLGNYGGPTRTMPPLPGSTAVDPAGGDTHSVFSTDQRGLPRVVNGVLDVGAVEVRPAAANEPVRITATKWLGDGSFQLGFTNQTGASFQMLAVTNVTLPAGNWPTLGPAVETPPGSGQFQFSDTQASNHSERFYRVRSP